MIYIIYQFSKILNALLKNPSKFYLLRNLRNDGRLSVRIEKRRRIVLNEFRTQRNYYNRNSYSRIISRVFATSCRDGVSVLSRREITPSQKEGDNKRSLSPTL